MKTRWEVKILLSQELLSELLLDHEEFNSRGDWEMLWLKFLCISTQNKIKTFYEEGLNECYQKEWFNHCHRKKIKLKDGNNIKRTD